MAKTFTSTIDLSSAESMFAAAVGGIAPNVIDITNAPNLRRDARRAGFMDAPVSRGLSSALNLAR